MMLSSEALLSLSADTHEDETNLVWGPPIVTCSLTVSGLAIPRLKKMSAV